MANSIHRLFVYSSLRSGFQHPAYTYISKYFTLEAEVVTKGKLYDINGLIVGVPTEENHFIKGELYLIKEPSEFSWAIGQLDDYEGVKEDEDNPTPIYTRSLATILVGNTTEEAWVYWYNQPVLNGKFIESGDILTYLQQKQ